MANKHKIPSEPEKFGKQFSEKFPQIVIATRDQVESLLNELSEAAHWQRILAELRNNKSPEVKKQLEEFGTQFPDAQEYVDCYLKIIEKVMFFQGIESGITTVISRFCIARGDDDKVNDLLN
jgi:hypothetical protein